MAIGTMYRPLLELACEARVDVAASLARLGFRVGQVLDPATRLTPEQGRQLGRELIAQIRDPELGLRAAERLRWSDIDLLGYLLRYSTHALGALEQFARHAQLLGDTARGVVDRSRSQVWFSFGLSDEHVMQPEAADFFLAGLCRVVCQLSGGRARPTEVHLPRPRPRRPANYGRFFGCSVMFETERGLLVFDHASSTAPFADRDPRLLAILEARAEELCKRVPPSGLVDRVRSQIAQGLESGTPDQAAIAGRLGLGERTLRRHLREAGQSYRTILDDVRRERAVALVQAGQSVAAVAQRVGFVDASAFARAFRRWTGQSPSAAARQRERREFGA